MILANATIYTADPARPFGAAMAVRGGRVLHVGTYDSVKVCCTPTCCPLPPRHQRTIYNCICKTATAITYFCHLCSAQI
jgi:hypothetical protein